MRRVFTVTILLVFFLSLVSLAVSAEFWASKDSNKYHYPNCKWALQIKPSNLIKFNSPEEAVKAGYVPCKACKPPVASKAGLRKMETVNLVQFKR